MNIIFAHPGLTIVILSWIVCALIAISKNDKDMMGYAFMMTVLWGVYHVFKQ
jgi:hypothetical protein